MKFTHAKLDTAEAALLNEWRKHLSAELMYRYTREDKNIWRRHRAVLATSIRSIRSTRKALEWLEFNTLSDSAASALNDSASKERESK